MCSNSNHNGPILINFIIFKSLLKYNDQNILFNVMGSFLLRNIFVSNHVLYWSFQCLLDVLFFLGLPKLTHSFSDPGLVLISLLPLLSSYVLKKGSDLR
jgi:hypothetical protein